MNREQGSDIAAVNGALADNATSPEVAVCESATPLTSADFTGLKVTGGHPVAGGIPAVTNSMKHLHRETGLVRGIRIMQRINQKGGFDCPGCAWPDPDGHRSFAEFCENGAKAIAEEATLKRVTPEFFAEHSVDELAQQSDHWLGKQGRLTHPMLLNANASHYEPISWDDAFTLIADELNALASPDEAVFYTSGRTSNEAAFLYQLFIRAYGTNNLPDCSNMCHESSGCALNETIGVGKGTVHLDDFEKADLILVIGQNPGTNHPRMLSTLQNAARRGATIISINPLAESGSTRFRHPQEPLALIGQGVAISTLHLPVRINGDAALLKGIMKEMLAIEEQSGGFDHEFIRLYGHNYDVFIQDLRDAEWDDLVDQSGINREQMRDVAEIAMKSKATIACWAMGLTQHKNAVATIREVVNLLLLGGHIGKPGAGVCPVRGHSNVQGDRTMGIWEKMSDAWLDRLGYEFNFEPPRKHGYDTVEAIQAMHAGRASVFFGMGGNFLSATPDTLYTAEALRNCSLTAHVSTKLNRAHLVTGKRALILPCLGRTEVDVQKSGPQFVSVENSMGIVHSSEGKLEPASKCLMSEPMIVARLARQTLGTENAIDWEGLVANYDHIRDHIAKVIPGFENFNERVRRPEGFYLPNTARERVFSTWSGKANFTVNEVARHKLAPGQFLMMTIRSHDQYNTTIYGLDDRYRGISNERRVVFLNKDDIAEQSLKSGDVVDLVSHFEGEQRIAPKFIVVGYEIPRRCAATYFPETNVLVPIRSVADSSNTPTSKSVVISVHRHMTAD
jgi:molybdopterin-dependent oxidoreductase alpha subunit